MTAARSSGATRVDGGREAALRALVRVEEDGAYASLALNEVLNRKGLDRRETALATELTYGVCRRLITLDHVLNHFTRRGTDRLTPWIRNALRLGVYQILYSERIPVPAAVNASVALARRYGHSGTAALVNAVLRRVAANRRSLPFPSAEEDPVAYLGIVHSHPPWMVCRWLGRYGFEDTRRLLEYNNQAPPLTIRTNRLKTSPSALKERLAGEGVTATAGRFLEEALVFSGGGSLQDLASFQEGLFQVQDESSMLAGHVLAPVAGETVVDVAAAPGGKATHLAELMRNRGRVLANDIHPGRLELLRNNCRRLGIGIVEAVRGDALTLPDRLGAVADRVLVDAPCSGLGVLNRRPDARWRKREEDINRLAVLQSEIIDAAARCVKPGGFLLYSTCTIEPEENSGVCDRFLHRHPDFMVEDLSGALPPPLRHDQGAAEGRLQLLPFRHGVDGFFFALFRQKA